MMPVIPGVLIVMCTVVVTVVLKKDMIVVHAALVILTGVISVPAQETRSAAVRFSNATRVTTMYWSNMSNVIKWVVCGSTTAQISNTVVLMALTVREVGAGIGTVL
jgi:hypothetical protein